MDQHSKSQLIASYRKRYCERNEITFTRGRPNKKNDSAHIEQKNWDVVRKVIGYGKFDTYAQLDIIKRIERLLAFYQNYFQPSQKLVSKTRIGAKVRKKHDLAQTPAHRLLARALQHSGEGGCKPDGKAQKSGGLRHSRIVPKYCVLLAAYRCVCESSDPYIAVGGYVHSLSVRVAITRSKNALQIDKAFGRPGP